MLIWERILNTLWIYILAAVLIGAYVYQFEEKAIPCPLCMLQRIAIIAISIGPMLNLRFQIKPMHYGISLLAGVFGGVVSFRQICLHICPGFPAFGVQVFGLQLYTWAFLVFSSSVVGCSLLLLLYKPKDKRLKMHFLEKWAILLMLIVAIANTISTFSECGLSVCKG